jgi:sugar-specific transcriptional regulator TrmB
MYEETLARAGLSGDQSRVYEALLKQGPIPASKISSYVGLKRGLTYKILGELEEMGLVTKRDKPGAVALFEPAHPLKLKDLADQKAREASDAHVAIEGVIHSLISDFNLTSTKPGVLFYEGLDGIKKVLEDTLTSKTEICSYADIEAVMNNIEAINKAYVAKREKLGIKRRGILLDTPIAREYLKDYHTSVTESRLIHVDAPPFQSIMNIYDGKIAYITLQPNKMIGVIIADQHIYEMHRYLFEYLWGIAKKITPPSA